jgi:hypothetical protein
MLGGWLATFAAEWAVVIAKKLESTPELLVAVCSYPCVATSPDTGVRYVSSLLPFFLSATAVLLPALHQNLFPSFPVSLWLFGLFAPYSVLAKFLRKPIGDVWVLFPKKAETTEK